MPFVMFIVFMACFFKETRSVYDLVNLEQLYIEHQLGVGGNGRRSTSLSISSLGVDYQLSTTSLLHGYT